MKSLLFLPLLLLTVVFTSCKKETINEIVPNRTIITDVPSNSWRLDNTNGNNHYYVDIQMPEIDSRIQNSNGVLAYISFDGGNIYEALPDVFYGSTIVVEHSVGNIRLITQNSDGTTVNPPSDCTLKIVLIESENI
jgi:hypothetical protein